MVKNLQYDIDIPEEYKMTADEIHRVMLQDAPEGISTIEGDLVWSNTRPTSEESAKLRNLVAKQVLLQGFAQTATGNFLDMKGEADGVDRKKGEYAVHKIRIIGTQGTEIQVGRTISTKSDEYNKSIDFIIQRSVGIGSDGYVDVEAECTEIGEKGNVEIGTITVLTKSIQGITSLQNIEIITKGVDKEDDESYRQRIIENGRYPGVSANQYHYKKWAKEIEGIKYCKVFPLWDKSNGNNGNGTVKLVLADEFNMPVTEEKRKEVKNHVDPYPEGTGSGQAPVGATVTVISCVKKLINIDAQVSLYDGYVLSEVKKQYEINLKEYFAQMSLEETKKVSYARVVNKLLTTEGVDEYSDPIINGSTANIILDDDEVASVGSISLTLES